MISLTNHWCVVTGSASISHSDASLVIAEHFGEVEAFADVWRRNAMLAKTHDGDDLLVRTMHCWLGWQFG